MAFPMDIEQVDFMWKGKRLSEMSREELIDAMHDLGQLYDEALKRVLEMP